MTPTEALRAALTRRYGYAPAEDDVEWVLDSLTEIGWTLVRTDLIDAAQYVVDGWYGEGFDVDKGFADLRAALSRYSDGVVR